MSRRLLEVWTHPDPGLHDDLVAQLRARPEARQALRDMTRARELGAAAPRLSNQIWEETLRSSIADGTAVATTTSETIMVPDFTLPADYMSTRRTLRYTLWGKLSTVITTPGTVTHRLRWGGVAGTVLAASGAYAPGPGSASTDFTFCVEWTLISRAEGASGSFICFGQRILGDFDSTSSATIVGNLNMWLMPASAPAAVTVDTTTAKALSPTVQFSVNTAGTTTTTMSAILESLN